MLPRLNLQYLISYLGLIPFAFILFNKYYFFYISEEISQDFLIYYSIIILVFIGAINWNLQEKINHLKVIYGFIPSLFALVIIILNLYNYNFDKLVLLLVFYYYLQLICDFIFLYKKNNNKKSFYFLRLPLTFFITSIIFII